MKNKKPDNQAARYVCFFALGFLFCLALNAMCDHIDRIRVDQEFSEHEDSHDVDIVNGNLTMLKPEKDHREFGTRIDCTGKNHKCVSVPIPNSVEIDCTGKHPDPSCEWRKIDPSIKRPSMELICGKNVKCVTVPIPRPSDRNTCND